MNMKKMMAVFVVVVMASAAMTCIIVSPPTSGSNWAEGDTVNVNIGEDLNGNPDLQGFLKEGESWKKATDAEQGELVLRERTYVGEETQSPAINFQGNGKGVKLIIEGDVELLSSKYLGITHSVDLEIVCNDGELTTNGISGPSNNLKVSKGTVNSIGNNVIVETSVVYTFGVSAKSVTVTGSGTTLNAIGMDNSVDNAMSIGIDINGGTVPIDIEDGAIINAKGMKGGADTSAGIRIYTSSGNRNYNVTNGSVLNATSTSDTGYGIFIDIAGTDQFNITNSTLYVFGKVNGIKKEQAVPIKLNLTSSDTRIEGGQKAIQSTYVTPQITTQCGRAANYNETPVYFNDNTGYGTNREKNIIETAENFTIMKKSGDGSQRYTIVKEAFAEEGVVHDLGEIPSPPINELIFDRWIVKDENGNELPVVDNKVTLTKETGLFFTQEAAWKNVYNVSYYIDDTAGQQPAYTEKVAGTYTLRACMMEKPGYEFKNWYVKETQETKKPGDIINVDADLSIIAIWEKLPVVSYYLDDSSSEPYKTVPVKGEYTLEGPAKKDGYEFKGWMVNGEKKQAGDKIVVTADTRVVGVWEKIETPSAENNWILPLIFAIFVLEVLAGVGAIYYLNKKKN